VIMRMRRVVIVDEACGHCTGGSVSMEAITKRAVRRQCQKQRVWQLTLAAQHCSFDYFPQCSPPHYSAPYSPHWHSRCYT
jgi:hypothetical protein